MADDADLEWHDTWVEKVFQTPSPSIHLNAYSRGKLTENLAHSDHVLRGSRSFAARSFRSRNGLAGLRVPSDRTNNENVSVASSEQLTQIPLFDNRQILGEVSNNNQGPRAIPGRLRPSPTPSLKRKKAEAIVKAHGSPTHVRVTAGGRIVPSEQSPLCLPRYGYSAVKLNGGLIKFAPNHHVGKTLQWAPTAQDGSQNGFVAQDVEGRLYQIVNGTILPLNEVDGGLRLYMPAPNLNITERTNNGGNLSMSADVPSQEAPIPHQTLTSDLSPASLSSQINTLELEYAKYDHELKDLDKTEVIHGKTMGRFAKDALVAKRRELVITLDRIRKAIKALKERPSPAQQSDNRPQTPKIGSDRSFSSPSIAANQAFVQRNKSINTAPIAQPAYWNQAPFLPHPSIMGHGHMASNESSFMGPPYMMPPMGYFMHPPPFDGSVGWATPYQPFAESTNNPSHPSVSVADARPLEITVPQHDGSGSTREAKVQSPRQSRALALKDPDTKQIISVKSLLNPMSPVYKPSVDGANRSAQTSEFDHKDVKDRPPTSLSFTRLASTANDDSGGHSQQSTHHTTTTSSGSSIRTMDLFPHNTREHSMRKHEYPTLGNDFERENQLPRDSARASSDISGNQQNFDRHDADWNPKIPARTFPKPFEHTQQRAGTPHAPPGTPVASGANSPRVAHDKIFGHRHSHFLPGAPGQASQHPRSHDGASSDGDLKTATLDFSHKSRAWIEGYQAGVCRRAVDANRMGDFIDGYCSGLLKSQPSEHHSEGSSSQQSDVNIAIPATRQHVPFELAQESKDCLKEAMFSTSNENAILTPALDGPSIEDAHFNLGAWQKQHEYFMSAHGQGLGEFPFPSRSSSLAQLSRKLGSEDTPAVTQEHKATAEDHGDVLAQFANLGFKDKLGPSAKDKDSSSTISTTDIVYGRERSSMLNQGKRIISPLEWRTRSSLANVVNMTSNLFAHTQFDGQPGDKACSERESMLSSAAEISGFPYTTDAGSRFREVSLDGLSPTMSPEPLSPAVSPRTSPTKLFKTRRSPAKESSAKQSPTKAKLEHIANKVGIKVSPDKASGEAGSPNGKRHWKDLWKGARTLSGRHEPI